MLKFITAKKVKLNYLTSAPILVNIAAYSLMLLFFHAAIDKLVIFQEFQNQMSQSPLIPPQLISFLAVFVPGAEIIMGCFVVFDKTRRMGFLLSFVTMLIFTLYLIMLVTIVENPPCACGGILGEMGYTEHIIFNIAFTGIALFGFLKHSYK